MFDNLTDFRYIRSRMQAFGFYLAYLFFGLIFFLILGVLLGASGVLGTEDAEIMKNGKTAGYILGPIYSGFMAAVVTYHKGASVPAIIMMTTAGAVLSFAGLFFGMIAAAYATTRAYRFRH